MEQTRRTGLQALVTERIANPDDFAKLAATGISDILLKTLKGNCPTSLLSAATPFIEQAWGINVNEVNFAAAQELCCAQNVLPEIDSFTELRAAVNTLREVQRVYHSSDKRLSTEQQNFLNKHFGGKIETIYLRLKREQNLLKRVKRFHLQPELRMTENVMHQILLLFTALPSDADLDENQSSIVLPAKSRSAKRKSRGKMKPKMASKPAEVEQKPIIAEPEPPQPEAEVIGQATQPLFGSGTDAVDIVLQNLALVTKMTKGMRHENFSPIQQRAFIGLMSQILGNVGLNQLPESGTSSLTPVNLNAIINNK